MNGGHGRAAYVLLLALYVSTRIVVAWLADHPDRYRTGRFTVVTDITLYESWARAIVEQRQAPYSQVPIEYPPGVLPFAVVPQLGLGETSSYQTRFIALMVLVDIAAAIGLWRIACQGGSWLGLWLWTVTIPLLGPLVYARLDLVPAFATIWAIERASRRSWAGAGAFLGLGAMIKVYPALFLPLAFMTSPKRWRLVIGTAIPVVLLLAVVAGALPQLFRHVVVYHTARGLSIESSWGALLLVASKYGYGVRYDFDYGALLVQSSASSFLKSAGTLLMLSSVATGMLLIRRAPRRDSRVLANIMFGTLAIVLGVAGIFSPQFVIWLIALAAAALCLHDRQSRHASRFSLSASCVPLLLVLPIAAITQMLYPFLYSQLVALEPFALFLLVVRNALILCAGVAALVLTNRSGTVGRRLAADSDAAHSS